MNRGLSEKLKLAFPDVVPQIVVRPRCGKSANSISEFPPPRPPHYFFLLYKKNNLVAGRGGGRIPIIKFIFHFNFKLYSIVFIHYTEFFGGAFFFFISLLAKY